MRDRIILFLAVIVVFLVFAGNVTTSFEVNETKTVSASSEVNVSGSYKNQNTLNDSKIYPDNKTVSSHRIFGKGITIEGFSEINEAKGIKEKDSKNTEKDIIEITNNFISNNENFLNAGYKDLNIVNFDSDNANYYVNYQQHYKGIPVYQSFVGLTINREGRILIMGSDFHPGINVSTTPIIYKKELIEIVKNYESEFEILNFSLIIFPEETETGFDYYLAWEVPTVSTSGEWVFFIDAHTGELIYRYNAIKNLNGTVTGMIYPEHPSQEQVRVNFSYEFVYVNATINDSAVFYSNADNCLNNSMVTKEPINLTNISDVNLTFITKYDIEQGWDFAYVEVSINGISWEHLNGSHMTTYENPETSESYDSCEVSWVPGAPAYSGNSNGWVNEKINLNKYLNKTIFLRFRYIEDEAMIKEGIYFENITIATDKGIIFFDGAENGSFKWNFSGLNSSFSIQNSTTVISAMTNSEGHYGFENLTNGTLNLTSELRGLWADVDNEGVSDSRHIFILNSNETHNWNWNESDTSYKDSESNVYYHVNKIHDYFKKFDFEGMDYQIKITIYASEENGTDWCNAYYSTMYEDINLGRGDAGEGCENLALGSDVIYHEYTHGAVDHIYILLPYLGETGALEEAFADYFAATLNNNSLIAENILPGADVRNLDNGLTMDNWRSEVHDDGKIMGGALWNLREEFGSNFTDSLVFEAIRITPHAYNFSEFLENLLVADDDNANLWDGTPNKIKICDEFYERKIYSFWCPDLRPDLTVENITLLPENPNSISVVNITAVIRNLGNNINLNLSSVNVSLFIDDVYENSEILNLTNITGKEVNFNWNAIAGGHNLKINVDPENLVNETNESNNELTINLNVLDCDLNSDGLIINDYNDLIFAYKCFLGIEKNCKINYRDWNLIKKEYECFIGK